MTLCVLCVLCVSVVKGLTDQVFNHGDTENTEEAQRKLPDVVHQRADLINRDANLITEV